MKKRVSWFICLVAFLFVFSANVKAESYKAGGDCGTDLKWSLDYSGNLFIYGEGQMTNYGFWDYNKRGWGDYTSEIKKITVEKGATTIGRSAFSDCKNLTKVTLPSTVSIIESDAFSGCTALSSINLPEGLQEIGSGTFQDCISLTSIQIPKTLTNLGKRGYGLHTFSNTGLTKISIPSSVKKMAGYCFKDCPNLTSATINGTNLEIGYEAFMNCKKLVTVTMGSGVTSMSQEAFRGCSMLKNVTLGSNLTFIGGAAFRDCTSLKEINIPDKVTTLQSINWSYVFDGCTSLETVTLGVGVTNIGDYTFKNCSSLKVIKFAGAAPTFSGNNTFSGCGSLIAYYPGSSKTWDRSNMTAHGAQFIDWKSWTPTLDHYTPVLKSVGAASKGVTVKWQKLSNAKGYEVWRKVGNEKWTKAKTVTSGSTLSWTDTSVYNGKRYTYRICGTNGSQVSKVSNSKYLYYLTANTVSVAKSGSSAVVKWKKNSAATGYAVQYSTKKNFSNAKEVTVKGAKNVSKTIYPGIRGTCYIRVRSYKTVNGVTSYSAWSGIKTVKF
ncbi:MAG: fibronectin type III domain-containing protein [Eubacteriales bacterium]|nr:fibronectin type III domain-containing protein [Eubacteriales bacterium]